MPNLSPTSPAADDAAGRSERVGYLDGWRGLAIACVLVDHFRPFPAVDAGNFGVDLFFVLSGLLMSRLLFVRRTPLALFYKRRISRIVPVFVLFVTTVYGVAYVSGDRRTWTEILATLTFLRTYIPWEPSIWHTGLPIGHLWSLNVEEHGYVLLSLLTLVTFVRTREGWVLLGLGGLAIGLELVYQQLVEATDFRYAIRTETAAAHLLTSAGYFLIRHQVAPWVRPWMPVASLALAGLVYWEGMPAPLSAVASPYLLAFAVNHLEQGPAGLRAVLAITPLRLLGLCSYSVYLWQQPFYESRELFPPGMALVAVLISGAGSFYFFENPVRRWLNTHW